MGIVPAVPWVFLVKLVVVLIPFGYCSARLERKSLSWSGSSLITYGIISGIVSLLLFQVFWAWMLLACVLFALQTRGQGLRAGLNAAWALAILTVGYAAVWNCNYLFGKLVFGRLNDPALRDVDLAIYGLLFGAGTSYESIFPLWHNPIAFRIFENSYLLEYAEIVVVLLAAALWYGSAVTAKYLRVLFSAYVVGVLCFCIYPVVGPPIYFPESLSPMFHGTMTHKIMEGMRAEYQYVLTGAPLKGFGYFIAIPSLHVMVAILAQVYLARTPVLFWAFVPVNIAMIGSTFMLGYHYFVDIWIAVALVGVLLWTTSREELRIAASLFGSSNMQHSPTAGPSKPLPLTI